MKRTEKPCSHRWNYDADRTLRRCAACDVVQTWSAIKGTAGMMKWQAAKRDARNRK